MSITNSFLFRFVYTVGYAALWPKPIFIKKPWKCLKHSLSTCFNPYRDFFSLYTIHYFPLIPNTAGCYKHISFRGVHWQKHSWRRSKLFSTWIERLRSRNSHKAVYLYTGEKNSLKWLPGTWVNLFATSCVLNRPIYQLPSSFMSNTHFVLINLRPNGLSININSCKWFKELI